MIFNSLTFLVFLFIVYVAYWKLGRKQQNILLLIASYIFYGWWDWRFLVMIFASSLLDYWIGVRIAGTENTRHRKAYLALTLVSNLGMLGFFKYFNFFASSLAVLFSSLGFQAGWTTLNIVLPVGISFYTFKTLSYNIDVYRRECPAHRNILEFMTFIAFFPELVAGPIMRATNLLQQFVNARRFDEAKAKDGLRQMLWGFFQKMVVADGLADFVNHAYTHSATASGGELLAGTVFFAFQIYCDFAGYSNIASGCARLFGFELVRNFAYPYFSRDIAEFWQRWHISLSTWFRDYFYIPLGGSRLGFRRTVINVLLTFTISGLWHGANWTFIFWGLLNGLYFIPVLFSRRRGQHDSRSVAAPPTWRHVPAILLTFSATLVAWVFFRAPSLGDAFRILQTIILDGHTLGVSTATLLKPTLFVLVLTGLEWWRRDRIHPLDIALWPRPLRWASYNIAAVLILLFGTFKYTPFIYFQF